MDPLNPLRRHRRRPLYQRTRADPSTYLTTARLHLLRTLPDSHRLHSRVTFNGRLKPTGHPPDIPRIPFTDSELAQIRTKRRHAGDPEDVKYQLQDSKLVQMWNADYECEEQWREYDVARPVMESKREAAGLPEDMFHTDDVVGEKRRRRSFPEKSSGELFPGKTIVSESVVRSVELEDGEIEDAGKVGDTDVTEDDKQEATLQNLREQNKILRTANDAMRVLAKSVKEEKEQTNASPPTPSSARSDHSDSSEDGSGESDIAICDFDLNDLEDEDIEDNHSKILDEEEEDEDDDSGVRFPTYINKWLSKVGPDSQASKQILSMQDESEETQSSHELG